MYFGKEKEDTNIDKEFSKGKKINIDFSKLKLPLIIFGIIALLIIVIIILTSVNRKEDIKYFINLLGDENITIYRGDTYNEPGYNAFDSRHNKLNDQVIVDNQVNSDIIGKFQVTYTLKDVVKVRYVNVVEKPIGATSIYLKGVNGSINVYLKVGEKYNEPGYKAIDTVDSGLTDKVKVTGSVNTKKEGVYQLVYSVVNSSGITTSATRTVIVVSSNLNLNLSTKNYTNKNIKIYVNILDNYFDYLILPNNKKITEQNYEYEVSENGTYKFTLYNKHGDKVEKSIKITNIDKESPSGSCSGYYKDGKSYITVKDSDNVGISKYVIDNNSYTNSSITVNKELKKADIAIYDKAGNIKNISCNLEDKNEVKNNTTNNNTNNNSGNTNNTTNSVKLKWIDVTGIGCPVYANQNPGKFIPVNEEIADEFYSIFIEICNYVNSSPYLNKFQHAGAYVSTGGYYHTIGRAIDINNIWTYTKNGTTYKPYHDDGANTWYSYKKFICEVCGGKEDCPYNVNYQIFKRIFKPRGWCWGGNWQIEAFDPMHYDNRENCSVDTTKKITC